MQFDWPKVRALLNHFLAEGKKFLARREMRPVIFVAGAITAFYLLWQGVDILPRIFFDTRKFQAILESHIDKSRLALSYQGFDVSFFKGVRIIGLRVSFDRDFSKGRYSIEAPFTYIKLPTRSLFNQDESLFADARLTLDRATLSYWVADGADKNFLLQFREILQLTQRYHAECNDCNFLLNVKDNSYFKEVTPIEKLFFTLHHDGREIKALVRYESSVLGNGDFFGKFAACDSSECNNLEGYWYFKPVGLNLAVFNNFQKSYSLTSGIASGELAFDRQVTKLKKVVRGKETIENQVLSNFRMTFGAQNLNVRRQKQDWYKAASISLDTKLQLKNLSATGALDMVLDGHVLHVDFEGLSRDALPEKYAFSVRPKLFSDKPLELPGQVSLRGLKNFSVELGQRRYDRYSRTEMNFEVADGLLRMAHKRGDLTLQIPELRLALKEEALTGLIRVLAGNSSVAGNLTGALRLYPVSFKPLADPLLREEAGGPEQKIFTLYGRIACPLVAENIFWSDARPFIEAWLDNYWHDVENGIQYSWLPSHLTRREYFVRLIQNLDFSMPIEIKNFQWAQKTPLRGRFYFAPAYGGGGFQLETLDGLNSNQVSVSFGEENAPWITHTLKLNLPESYELLAPWFGQDFFDYFSSVAINYTNSFYGERPADHYLKSNSGMQIQFKRVRLGAWARAQNLPLQWNSLEAMLGQEAGLGKINNLRGESDNNLVYGYGEYRTFDRQVEATLKATLSNR